MYKRIGNSEELYLKFLKFKRKKLTTDDEEEEE